MPNTALCGCSSAPGLGAACRRYKKAGQTRTDSHGTPDTAEFFNISKDAMLDNKTSNKLSWPAPVLAHKPLLARYMRAAHYTGTTVLAVLSRKLGLTDGGDSEGGGIKGLASYHRIDEASGDHVRLTRGPPRHSADLPEIQTPGHTDFGSITILFNWLGGLQVWSDPSRGETGFANIVDPGNGRQGDARSGGDGGGRWLWVIPPPPGTAIVNLGDAAVKFSGGVLCSGRHRVVPGPGEQGTLARYSVVYFVRPEDKTLLRRLRAPGIPEAAAGEDGEEPLNAKEWIIRQSAALGNKIERP